MSYARQQRRNGSASGSMSRGKPRPCARITRIWSLAYSRPRYARALLSADPGATPEEVERRVAARMERQSILSRVAYIAVLDESALRRPVAEPKVMHDQLLSLLDRQAELQVIEFGAHPGLNGPLVIATFDGSEVAYVEGQLQGRVLERREDLLSITRIWETLRGEALSKRRSRELILEVADSWKP